METKRQKAMYYLAKSTSLSNAAEFIRSHGEEGFSFEDKDFNKKYLRENQILYKQLQKRASNFYKKYLEMEIEIDMKIDVNYF